MPNSQVVLNAIAGSSPEKPESHRKSIFKNVQIMGQHAVRDSPNPDSRENSQTRRQGNLIQDKLHNKYRSYAALRKIVWQKDHLSGTQRTENSQHILEVDQQNKPSK